MTKDDIVNLCNTKFYKNFAVLVSDEVLRQNALNVFLDVHFHYKEMNLPKSINDKLAFRSSYILETLYFTDKSILCERLSDFSANFVKADNESMKRHYGKICADLLIRGVDIPRKDDISEVAMRWILEPKAKIAVKIWAIEVLILLKDEIDNVGEYLDQILSVVSMSESSALRVRMKKWNNL